MSPTQDTCTLCGRPLVKGVCGPCQSSLSAKGGKGDTEPSNRVPAAEDPPPSRITTGWHRLAKAEDEERGSVAAASILLATFVADVLTLLSGGLPPDVYHMGAKIGFAGALVRGVGWARFLLIVEAVWNLVVMGLAYVIAPLPAILGALPSVFMLAAFYLATPNKRAVAALCGIVLTFSRFASPPPTQAELFKKRLSEAALKGDRFVDPAGAFSLAVPNSITLYDTGRFLAALGKTTGGGDAVTFASKHLGIVGGVRVQSLPRHLALEKTLYTLDIDEAELVTMASLAQDIQKDPLAYVPDPDPYIDETLVPAHLRKYETQGWCIPRRGKYHYVILVRTESGAVLALRSKVPAASRVLDRKIFNSIARAWKIPAQ